MSRMERVYRIERLLKQNRFVPIRALIEDTEVSRATLKRDLEYMRDRLNAPIVWDREARGYRLEGPYAAPGLYFSPSEIHALLILQHLVARLQPTFLEQQVSALGGLLEKAVGDAGRSPEEMARRIRILQVASRPIAAGHFQTVGNAMLSRKRLDLVYYSRARDEQTRRQVSPQRLVYYRDNWYLDAWCHLRKGLRSFSLDAIRSAAVTARAAREIPEHQLDRDLGGGYGIFSGSETKTAVLRFAPEVARWVSCERWHSAQKGRFEPDGRYVLEIPYAADRELIMDILRFGADAEVLRPRELRAKVRGILRKTLAEYEN
jgi:predicted DNA-binding transcriptional regulator YafY